jgi:flagellar FliJ protein
MKSRESILRLKRFQVDEKRRQVTQIETMINEFHRVAKELDNQVVAEQERVGITDVTHFAYPIFAKSAMSRRDNLIASANELQGQHEAAQDILTEALKELAKYENLQERERERIRAASGGADNDSIDKTALERALSF